MSDFGLTFTYAVPPEPAAIAGVQHWVQHHPSFRWERPITAPQIAEAMLDDPALVEALNALESPLGQAVIQAALGLLLPPVDAALVDSAVRLVVGELLYRRLPWWQRVLISLGLVAHP